MGILDDDVARVREATDLVALASEHLALKRVGRRYTGLCPFHVEKSPSFTINPELGVYYCFGCQARGDGITFIREVEHLDFVEAVERLAARAGINLRYDDVSFSKDRARTQRLHAAVAEAIAFYHRLLLEAPEAGGARGYLRSRGFDGAAARRFSIGYAPDGYDRLSVHLQQAKHSRDDIVAAGLAFVNKSNRLQDSFRSRLMFPIWDGRGEPVGFGGRTLNDQGPKYKNSQDTPIYHKSRLLYGLNWAKGEIVARGEVVLCEGYTDVMALHLTGVENAVATCGTALADEHFSILKNLARKVILAYDADSAGQAAADRCYAWEQRYEVEFQVADLPSGRDPADVWQEDPQALRVAVASAKPFLEFRISRLLDAAEVGSIEGRSRAAERAAALIAEHPSELVRDQYVMSLAGRLDIDADRLRSEVSRARSGERPARKVEPGSSAANDRGPVPERVVDRRELDALRWAVHAPELVGARIGASMFVDPLARAAFDTLAGAEDFLEAVSKAEPEVAALIERLAVEDPEVRGEDPELLVTHVVVNLVEASSKRLLESMLNRGDERTAALKVLIDVLVRERDAGDWRAAEAAAAQLVGWQAEVAEWR